MFQGMNSFLLSLFVPKFLCASNSYFTHMHTHIRYLDSISATHCVCVCVCVCVYILLQVFLFGLVWFGLDLPYQNWNFLVSALETV